MATDATGAPTTALGIPKYNTAADIPSGKGFNAAMEYIDDLIEARGAPPGASGVKVWNNTTKTWDTPAGADGTKFLRDDGTFAATASPTIGAEVAYTERTSNLALTTAIADIIDTGLITYLNVPYLIEFFCGKVDAAASAAGTARFSLYDGATDLGILAEFGNQTWGSGNFTPSGAVYAARKITPTAASHQYKIRVAMTSGTGTAYGGLGGAATMLPIFARITRTT